MFFEIVDSTFSILPVHELWRKIFSTHFWTFFWTFMGTQCILSAHPFIWSFTCHFLSVYTFFQLCSTVQLHGFPELSFTTIVVIRLHHSGSVGVFIFLIFFKKYKIKNEYKKINPLVKSFFAFYSFFSIIRP